MSVIDLLTRQPIAQAIGWALLQFLWQGAVLGVIAAVALSALRRSAPDIRYVVASIALAVMATLPIVTALQAGRNIAAPEERSIVPPATARATVSPDPDRELTAAPDSADSANAPGVDAARPLNGRTGATWLALFAAAWLCGVLILSLRLATGWMWIQRLKSHRTTAVSARWQYTAQTLARRLHIRRPVRLLESASIAVPTVIGWLRPVVLMPASALAGLAPEQLQAILAHELAHIRRHDYLVNLLQTLVETLLFYHPAVWWLSRRIRAEREHCCDDLAVSLCGDPYTYARALADLEGLRAPSVPLVLAATGGSLLGRVRRLVIGPSHAGRGPGWLAGTVAVLVIAGVGLGAIGNEWRQSERRSPTAASRGTRDTSAMQGLPTSSLREAREAAYAARIAVHEIAVNLQRTARSTRLALQQATRSVAIAVRAAVRPNAIPHSLPYRPSTSPNPPVHPDSSAPSMPAAADHPAQSTRKDATVTSQTSSGGSRQHGTIGWSHNGEKLEVSFDGEFEFTDDDLDIKRMSPNGSLRITDGGWFTRHTVEFKADASGTIERHYRDGSGERPFDPEGRQWLARVLPGFIRQSGIGAPARVARILKQGGPAAVLREISLIDGAYAKRAYFTELMKAPALDAATRVAVLTQAGREIDSDFELATFLIEQRDRLVSDDGARRAYLEAARRIKSDFELRRVLSAAVEKGPLTPALLTDLLEASTSIDSDFEQASLLVQVAKQTTLDGSARGAFFRALDTVASDFEHHRVLTALAERTDLTDDLVRQMLTSSATLGSDFEQGTFLVQIAGRRSIGAVREPFFQAVSHVGSAFERGRVLQAVLKQPDVPQDVLVSVLLAIESVGAFEASQVLQAAAPQRELTGHARDLYVSAASRLGAFEQGQALAALARTDRR